MCEAKPRPTLQWILDHGDELARRFEEAEPTEQWRNSFATPPERWLNSLDPATTPARDGRHLRAIGAAVTAVETAEARLQESVAEARVAGDSWTMIATVLGVTRDTARRRYESAAETLDILSTPGALEAIQEGLADAEAGRTVTMDDIRAEFGRPADGGGPAVGAGC